MVRLTKIYTRGGDQGVTSLASGERRPKHDLRIEAYGTIDETNAAIGVARLYLSAEVDALYARIQQELFDLGADLATPHAAQDTALRMVPEQVARLEQEIDRMNATLSPLASFVLPGGAPAAAFLHLARTICRRGERLLTALAASETVNPVAMQYINRLSDHIFVAARHENTAAGSEVLWVPASTRAKP